MKRTSLIADNSGVMNSFLPLVMNRSASSLRVARPLLLCAALLCGLSASSLRATPESFTGTVRVGVTAASGSSATLELTGPAQAYDLATGQPVGALKAGPLRFTLKSGSVSCPSLPAPSSEGFRLEPGPNSLICIGKRSYRGAFEVWDAGKNLNTINEMDMEEYVFGSMLIEGAPSLHPEALKSLAVAVRTYANRNRGRHGDLYDVCDTTHCQGYVGLPAKGSSDWASRATKETGGEILTYDHTPIWAMYSTACGGATANNEDGGMGSTPWPYLRGVIPDGGRTADYCSAGPIQPWTYKIPVEKLEGLLNRQSATAIGKLSALTVEQSDAFGRAVTLRIEGRPKAIVSKSKPSASALKASAASKPVEKRRIASAELGVPPLSAPALEPTEPPAPPPTVKTMKAASLRLLIGANTLKSTLFTVEMVPGFVVFKGKGYGHGVGMCVHGANGMAKAGHNYRQILSHYYRQVSLANLYEPLPEDDLQEVAGTATAP